jgi:hypothetical protein
MSYRRDQHWLDNVPRDMQDRRGGSGSGGVGGVDGGVGGVAVEERPVSAPPAGGGGRSSYAADYPHYRQPFSRFNDTPLTRPYEHKSHRNRPFDPRTKSEYWIGKCATHARVKSHTNTMQRAQILTCRPHSILQ